MATNNGEKNIWTASGVTGFTRIDASHGKIGDMLFTDNFRNKNSIVIAGRGGGGIISVQNDEMLKKAVNDIVTDLTKHPLKEGQQLNLAGYSYGAIMQEHIAIELVNKGYKIDNLILIASPTSDDSPIMEELQKNQKAGKIGKIIRHDIPGDHLSNPDNIFEYTYGAWQNRKDSGPHFDLARPNDPSTHEVDEGKEADKKIKAVGNKIKNLGIQ